VRRLSPSASQTALELAKLQANSDVGLAILEAYSRALEVHKDPCC